MTRATSIQLGEEGAPLQGEGAYTAARRYAYLGTVEKVRIACLNEVGRAPPRWFIEETLEAREKRLTRDLSLGYLRRSKDAIKPHDADDERSLLDDQNNRFLRALQAERAASAILRDELTPDVVNVAWNNACRSHDA